MTLRIASRLALDDSYITKVAAVIAQRRKGKTYTASVIAEEMVNAGLPFVVVDPTGAWWGLRASADGKKAGLPVTILGGQHGDVPIDSHSGRVIADLVVDHPSWYVCDLSLFDSHEAERTFVRALVERLYRRKAQPSMDFPLQVVLDEADLYAPEQPLPGDQPMLGAVKTMVKRGGLRGIGCTVITQRPASLSKHVLEQADMLVLLRLVGPNDRAAVDRYVKDNAEPAQRDEMMKSLPSMKLGEAWVWEPGAEPPLFERVQIRQRKTFNSSATPEPGQQQIEPRVLADVDLEAVKDMLAEIVERAEADNPDRLRARIRHLEDEIAQLRRATPQPEQDHLVAPVELIDGMYKTRGDITAFADHLQNEIFVEMHAVLDRIGSSIDDVMNKLGNMSMRRIDEFPDVWDADKRKAPHVVTAPGGIAAPMSTHYDPNGGLPAPKLRDLTLDGIRADIEQSLRTPVEYPQLDSVQRSSDETLLDVLAWFATIGVDSVDRPTLALFAGVSPKSSSYGKALSRLLSSADVHYPSPGTVALTENGQLRARPQSKITTNEQLHEQLLQRLPSGQAKIVNAFLTLGQVCPLSRVDLAERAQLSPSSSSYGKDLAALVRYGFLWYPEPGIVAPVVSRLWPLSS